jgi:membrane associated rhomboid family serine protease
MFIPIRTDYRMARTPWVNYALVAANVLLYLVGYQGGSPQGMVRIDHLLLHPDAPRLYQFFSSVFLHGSLPHLLGNMVFLWIFGNAINDRFGQIGYLAFYLAGGVLAGIGYVLLSGHAPVLGASGAISAVTGAYLMLLPRVRVTLLIVFYFITTMEVSSLYFLMFQFAFNLWMSLTPRFTGIPEAGVAYAAHSSGYLFGVAVTVALLAVKLLPRDPLDLLNLMRSARRRQRYRRIVRQGLDPFGTGIGQDQQRRWVEARTVQATPGDTPAARELQLRRQVAEAYDRHDLAETAERYLQLVQIAEDAVLTQGQQLDVANKLMESQRYPAAADAYERFLRHYGNYEHVADIYLMLGLLYGRYLHQYERARQFLHRAVGSLTDQRKLQLARGDLEALQDRP